MWNPREQDHQRIERLRGWIIYLIYQIHPQPLELSVLMELLDARNFPLSRRSLAKELDYLRQLRVLRVFPVGTDDEHDPVRQAKMLQKYAQSESDTEARQCLCVRLTAIGIDFQEDNYKIASVQRVE